MAIRIMKGKSLLQVIMALWLVVAMLWMTAAPIGATASQIERQTDTGVTATGGFGQLLQFTSGGQVLGFDRQGTYIVSPTHMLKASFVGANPVDPQAEKAVTAEKAGAAAPMGKVTYTNLWDGVRLVYEAKEGTVIKSTYYIDGNKTEAALNRIHLSYNRPVKLDEQGNLVVAFETGNLVEKAPVAWQEVDGAKVPVTVAYKFESPTEIGFTLDDFMPGIPVVIDPDTTWNTFLGGTDNYAAYSIAVDSSGNVYVVGDSSASWGSPVRAFKVNGSNPDAFVAKLNSNGVLQWNTFLGGPGMDAGRGVAVDSSGYVYVCGGDTGPWGINPVRAFTGDGDAFAARLNSNGVLLWNTFLGGTGKDQGVRIAADSNGNVYMVGHSNAAWGSPLRDYSSDYDVFAVKLDSSGTLLWNTFLGGNSPDYSGGIALDSSGNVYVVGDSSATWDNPVRAYTGSSDAFAAKLNSSGAFQWNTFLGGMGDDYGRGITADSSGNVYLTGYSNASWGSPTSAYTSDDDAFAARLESSGALLWNTFLGGTGKDRGAGIAVDSSGNIYVSGGSESAWGSPARAFTGNGDVFAARLDSIGALQWSTFLGGTGPDHGRGIALDTSGNVYITGDSSASWGSPVKAFTGYSDAFATKVNSLGALQWNTFVGGMGGDYGYAISLDSDGNVYVVGGSDTTWDSPVRAYSGGYYDAFAAKLNSNGVLQWNTFLGGTGVDYGYGVAVDSSGNVYLTGYSNATWGNPLQPFSGNIDAFAAKLDGNGALLWNSFLGGTGGDEGYGIAVDSSGSVYMFGESSATWGSPIRAYSGSMDAFAVKLDNSGALLWNTFLGGTGSDYSRGIAVDSSGNVYVAGLSNSNWGSPIILYSSSWDSFVAKLNSSGALQWNAFLGGTGIDTGNGIVVDSSSNVYVTGFSSATWGNPVRLYSGNFDAFAAKLNSGGVLLWNTFLGENGDDTGWGIALDSSSNVYVTGYSYATWGSPVRAYSGYCDAFAVKLNGSGALQWNTFLGGTGNDGGQGIAVDSSGNVYVAGSTSSCGVAWGNPVRDYTATSDAFVVKLNGSGRLELIPTVVSISPSSGPTAGGTSVTITGDNFTGVTAVKFGTDNATWFNVDNNTQITATAPAGAGTVDVTVTTAGGTSVTSSADQFTYTVDVYIAVALQGGSRPDAGWVVPLTVKFFDNSTGIPGALLYTFVENTTKSGSLAVATVSGIIPGTYDISAVSPTCLTNIKKGVVIAASSTAVDLGTLLEGDAVTSGASANAINAQDFGALAASYNKSWGQAGYNDAADFDRSGRVNALDFGLLAANYGKSAPVEVP